MASKIPYNTSSDALLHPAKNAVFFPGWVPEVDNKNHDLLCAEMSRLAYAPRAVVRSSLKSIGFAVPDFIGGDGLEERLNARGTQGFVARHLSSNLSVLAFRGTESDKFEDLISDANILQRAWPSSTGCPVHAGFAACWGAVAGQVTSLLPEPKRTLLITGHSLGAALATLAAIVLKPAKLILFGSPRVGNEKLGALLAGVEVRRFVHCCDLIARIPPEQIDQRHVGDLLTELAHPGLHNFLERSGLQVTAGAIALMFQSLRLDPQFQHVGIAQYADRNGKVLGEVTDQERLLDQDAARGAYTQPAHHESLSQLGERLKGLTLTTTASGDALPGALEVLRSFTGHLFAETGPSVALRDLADHAPINYVSLFTGRP